MEAKNQSKKNVYVRKVKLNVEPLTESFIKNDQIMSIAMLTFYRSNKPNKNLYN